MNDLSRVGLLMSLVLVAGWSEAQPPVVRVGVITDGPWHRNQEFLEVYQAELLTLTRGEFDVRFPAESYIEAEWTDAGIRFRFGSPPRRSERGFGLGHGGHRGRHGLPLPRASQTRFCPFHHRCESARISPEGARRVAWRTSAT